MVVDNAHCLLGGHLDVGDLLLAGDLDLDDGLILADTDAAGLGDGDVLGQTALGDFFCKSVEYGTRAGGDTAGSHTDQYLGGVGVFLAQIDLCPCSVPDSL